MRVREEDGGVERVVLARRDEVGGKDDRDENKRDEPCMLQRESFRAAQDSLRLLPLATALSGCVWLFPMLACEDARAARACFVSYSGW